MALTKIINGVINDSAITSTQIAANTIITDQIQSNDITGTFIANNTLTTRKLLSSTNSFQQLTYNTSGVAAYQTNKSTCINRIIYNYTGGAWGPPSTSEFTWVPGLYYDYTPVRADSLIKWSANFSVYWNDPNSYGIMHQYFYWNNRLRDSWTYGGIYYEHRTHYERIYPSWGTTSGRIGIQSIYYSGSYYGAYHGTHYWNGAGGNSLISYPQLVIEEFLNN
jgi:hypothetical protein